MWMVHAIYMPRAHLNLCVVIIRLLPISYLTRELIVHISPRAYLEKHPSANPCRSTQERYSQHRMGGGGKSRQEEKEKKREQKKKERARKKEENDAESSTSSSVGTQPAHDPLTVSTSPIVKGSLT